MKKFVTKSLTYVVGLVMAVTLAGCSVGGTGNAGNTGNTTAPTAEQQNSGAVPPEAASKLHLKDGDTFPEQISLTVLLTTIRSLDRIRLPL